MSSIRVLAQKNISREFDNPPVEFDIYIEQQKIMFGEETNLCYCNLRSVSKLGCALISVYLSVFTQSRCCFFQPMMCVFLLSGDGWKIMNDLHLGNV